MKFVNFGILIFFLPTYFCVDLKLTDPTVKELANELGFTCKNGALVPNDFFAAGVQACDAVHGPGKKNSADCIFFCYGKLMGLMGDDGVSTWDTYEKLILAVVPTEHHQRFTTWIKDCWDRFGSKMDRKEATCAMAGQFNKCSWAILPHLTC